MIPKDRAGAVARRGDKLTPILKAKLSEKRNPLNGAVWRERQVILLKGCAL